MVNIYQASIMCQTLSNVLHMPSLSTVIPASLRQMLLLALLRDEKLKHRGVRLLISCRISI